MWAYILIGYTNDSNKAATEMNLQLSKHVHIGDNVSTVVNAFTPLGWSFTEYDSDGLTQIDPSKMPHGDFTLYADTEDGQAVLKFRGSKLINISGDFHAVAP
jgi:hypothetical protein